MEAIIIIIDIFVLILLAFSFVNFFKTKKLQRKIITENNELDRKLKTANLAIQTLQEQLDIKRDEYDKLLSENKHLYEQLKSYQNIVDTQEAIEKVAEELQENVEVEEPKKAVSKKATSKKTTSKKAASKKTTTKKTTTKKTTTKKATKKEGENE